MIKKILFAVEILLIACILITEIPHNNIPAISEILETATEEYTIELSIGETTEAETERETETTEIIEITTVPEVIITTEEIPLTTETEKFLITDENGDIIEIDKIDEEESEIIKFDGPEQFIELYEVIAKYGSGVSVFYRDIKDGEEYFYNPGKNYFIASLIKAPYVVYAYRCILDEENIFDLTQKYKYLESDYRQGTGKIKEMAYGTEFTVHELISYAIRWSDNVAMDKLRKIFPISGFREFAAEIGLPHIADIRSSAVNGVICAKCAAAYTGAIYNFIEEGNQYSEILKQHMLNTINPMIYANYPFVRKYGWAEDSFHDMGIVYNENRPYLIAILSDKGEGDLPMFRDISLAVQRYNESKPPYEEPEPEETEDPE